MKYSFLKLNTLNAIYIFVTVVVSLKENNSLICYVYLLNLNFNLAIMEKSRPQNIW